MSLRVSGISFDKATLTYPRIKEARRHVPRYLFRAWSASSGGAPELNTREAITPSAFLSGAGHEDAYSLTTSEFIRKTLNHLTTKPVQTEFSSWTASLNFARCFAYQRNNGVSDRTDRGTAYISVIDTEVFVNSNKIWYVPSLAKIFSRAEYKIWHWEYLVHGPVSGLFGKIGHKAVKFDRLVELGLCEQLSDWPGDSGSYWYSAGQLDGKVKSIELGQIDDFERVGAAFGGRFSVPITLALLCTCRRSATYWNTDSPPEELVEYLIDMFGVTIPDWSDESLSIDVHPSLDKYQDAQQMFRLMRAIQIRRTVCNQPPRSVRYLLRSCADFTYLSLD